MRYFTVNEIAQRYGKNPETVRRWIRDGKLKAEQHSKKEGNIVSEVELEAFEDIHMKGRLKNVRHLDDSSEPIIYMNGLAKHISELTPAEKYKLIALLRCGA